MLYEEKLNAFINGVYVIGDKEPLYNALNPSFQ